MKGFARAFPARFCVKKQIVFQIEPKSVSKKQLWEQGALSLLSHVFCVPKAEFTKADAFVQTSHFTECFFAHFF
jgi:hypothetical protein